MNFRTDLFLKTSRTCLVPTFPNTKRESGDETTVKPELVATELRGHLSFADTIQKVQLLTSLIHKPATNPCTPSF